MDQIDADADIPALPPVNEATARSVSAVYRGAALLAGAVASLRLQVVHQPNNQISQVTESHRLASILDFQPDPKQSMTAYSFKNLIMQSRIFGGNFYARILYDNAARVIGLRHYPYQRVRVVQIMDPPYTRWYTFSEPDGKSGDPVPDDEVLHIMADANNGIIGESLIFSNAKTAIQQQLFMQTQSQNVHRHAIKPGGVVKLPSGFSADQKKRIQEFFKQKYQGSVNTGNLLWLDVGAEYQQLSPSLSLVDLQTIEFLRYGVNDIARFLGIPSHLLNEQSQTSAWGSGIESIGRAFLQYTLEPHLRAIEEEMRLKLFGKSDFEPRFDRSPLQQTDAKTQAEIESRMINAGVWTINERRKKYNLPPQDDGDQSLVNSTLVPLSKVGEDPAPQIADQTQQPEQPADEPERK